MYKFKNLLKKDDNVVVDPDELAIAEKEAEASESAYTHKFQRPYEYEGKQYSELTFDWETLTGDDGLAIENEMQQLGKPVIVPTFSGEYLVRLAAKACTVKIGDDVIRHMPISDYNKIRSAARSFLLKSELQPTR